MVTLLCSAFVCKIGWRSFASLALMHDHDVNTNLPSESLAILRLQAFCTTNSKLQKDIWLRYATVRLISLVTQSELTGREFFDEFNVIANNYRGIAVQK